MITLFPAHFDDELDFSIFARYCARKPYASKRAFVEELFGKGSIIATVGFTSNIAYFIKELAPGTSYNVDDFINRHTFLPYHVMFLDQCRVADLRKDMCADNGPGIHLRAGLMASKIPLPSFLKLCPSCIEQDREREGTCYWHRKHQPFGVEVCAVHGDPLIQTDVAAYNRQTRYEFITAEQALKQKVIVKSPVLVSDYKILLAIAQSVAWALEQQCWCPGSTFIRERYFHLLEQQGYVTSNRRVRMASLVRRFNTTYSLDTQRQLHCELNTNSDDNWLARLLRNSDTTLHPLYHLLLIYLLDQRAEDFFSLDLEPKTFGTGPWPCLNAACESYHQLTVRLCQTYTSRYTDDKPVGIFTCPICGFSYARTWDGEPSNPFRLQRIVKVGPVWEAWLSERWGNENISLRALAKQLGVDPNTIRAHALRLGLPFPRPGGKAPAPLAKPVALCHDNPKETYRQLWLKARQEHPNAGLTLLRKITQPKVYTWLYRNDKEWLASHVPTSHGVNTRKSRFDWDERDRDLCEQIPQAVEALNDVSGRPRKITITAIGRELGHLAVLQQHLDKLPLCRTTLENVIDTQLSWAVRRIQYVVNQALNENNSLQHWQVVRAAGVGRLLEEVPVKEALCWAVTVMAIP